METLLKALKYSNEEVWLIINSEFYYVNIINVSNELVTFSYTRYSASTKMYSLWERTLPLSLIEGVERKLASINENINEAIKSIPITQESNPYETDARNPN